MVLVMFHRTSFVAFPGLGFRGTDAARQSLGSERGGAYSIHPANSMPTYHPQQAT